MGWFLWGVAFGWAVCATFYYSQTDNEKAASAATIIFLALAIMATVVSISLGVSSGVIPASAPTITPTSLGR